MKLINIIISAAIMIGLSSCSPTMRKDKSIDASKRLHDIWITTTINGNPINRMTPIPRMELNLSEMSVMGNDSCNDYTGDIENATDTQLVFGNIAATKKMCRKMDTADSFNKAMNLVASYNLENLKLVLMDKNGNEVLTFLKGD